MVRAITALTRAVERVESKVDNLDTRYVPRELWTREYAHLEGRVDELGQRVVDVQADQARLRQHLDDGVTAVRRDMLAEFKSLRDEARQTWRAYIAPVFTGCAVALFVLLANRMAGG